MNELFWTSGRPRHDYSWLGWIWLSLALTIVIGSALFLGEYSDPGRMEFDAKFQMQQALGEKPLNDWHPVILTVFWAWLIDVTGNVGAMLWVQIWVIAAVAYGLCVYLYDLTRRIWWSALGLAVFFLPYMMNVYGMIWKDTQMVMAFLGSVVLTLLATRFRRLQWPLLIIAVLLMIYGTEVRKNAAFAVPPLAFLMLRTALAGTRWEARVFGGVLRRVAAMVAATAVVGAGVVVAGKVIDNSVHPEKTSQISQIYLDDVIFVVPPDAINASDAPPELKQKLIHAQDECRRKNQHWNAYWRCYGTGVNGPYTPIAHGPELAELWRETVPQRPQQYLQYRLMNYQIFLTTTWLEWLPGKETLKFNTDGERALNWYVTELGVKRLAVLFDAWFWFVISCALPLFWRLYRPLRLPIMALSTSALCYLVGFFPIIPESQYRYHYWAAAACTLALVLVAVDLTWQIRHRRFALADPSAVRTAGSAAAVESVDEADQLDADATDEEATDEGSTDEESASADDQPDDEMAVDEESEVEESVEDSEVEGDPDDSEFDDSDFEDESDRR